MLNTLPSTKLYIPRPHRELVSRSRLLERIDAGRQGKLTLVSAPAGYAVFISRGSGTLARRTE